MDLKRLNVRLGGVVVHQHAVGCAERLPVLGIHDCDYLIVAGVLVHLDYRRGDSRDIVPVLGLFEQRSLLVAAESVFARHLDDIVFFAVDVGEDVDVDDIPYDEGQRDGENGNCDYQNDYRPALLAQHRAAPAALPGRHGTGDCIFFGIAVHSFTVSV